MTSHNQNIHRPKNFHSRTESRISPLKFPSSGNSSGSGTQLRAKGSATQRDKIVCVRQFPGAILENNYIIGEQIGTGSFGQVFEVTDIRNKELSLVVKISANLSLSQKEIEAM